MGSIGASGVRKSAKALRPEFFRQSHDAVLESLLAFEFLWGRDGFWASSSWHLRVLLIGMVHRILAEWQVVFYRS